MADAVQSSAPAGAPLEARLPCPVCLGVQMEKVHLDDARGGAGAAGGRLTLDHCPRCGGVWFERGEAGRLAAHAPQKLWAALPRRQAAPRPPCHECHTPLDRDAERCPACGAANVLLCPMCDREMERRTVGQWMLDMCKHCRGVWFDHVELDALWTMNLEAAARRRGGLATGAAAGGEVLLDALAWNPYLIVYGAQGLGHAVAASAELAGRAAAHAPGAIGGAAEVAGEAAAGVFEAIMDMISSLFD